MKLEKTTCSTVLLLLLCSWILPASATGSDIAKERRWANQIVDSLLDELVEQVTRWLDRLAGS